MRRRGVLFGVLAVLTIAGRVAADAPSHALIPMFENQQVRVWKTVLQPGERIGMHRHEHGRVVVALKGGTLEIPQQTGGSRQLRLQAGQAYWLEADPPGQLHGDFNPSSSQTLEMMVVEMR